MQDLTKSDQVSKDGPQKTKYINMKATLSVFDARSIIQVRNVSEISTLRFLGHTSPVTDQCWQTTHRLGPAIDLWFNTSYS